MRWFLHIWAIAWRQRDGAFYVRTYVRVRVHASTSVRMLGYCVVRCCVCATDSFL